MTIFVLKTLFILTWISNPQREIKLCIILNFQFKFYDLVWYGNVQEYNFSVSVFSVTSFHLRSHDHILKTLKTVIWLRGGIRMWVLQILGIESTIRTFCEFEDYGFPNKGQKWMRIYMEWILNPHILQICELRIPQRSSQNIIDL